MFFDKLDQLDPRGCTQNLEENGQTGTSDSPDIYKALRVPEQPPPAFAHVSTRSLVSEKAVHELGSVGYCV